MVSSHGKETTTRKPAFEYIHHLFRFSRGEMLNFRCVFHVHRIKFIQFHWGAKSSIHGRQGQKFQSLTNIPRCPAAVFHSHERLDISGIT